MSTDYLTNDSFTNQLESVSLNSEQATSLIIERARQLVNRLVGDRGHDKPPFLPQEFLRLVGIKRIVQADLGIRLALTLQ